MRKLCLVLVGLFLVTGCGDGKEENLLGINYQIDSNQTELTYEVSNPVAAIYVKDYGSIVIELYPEIAPNTVNNFISLTNEGFYDNNTFHRLDKEFVLQGGDPTGKGTGGPNYSIKGEFSNNEIENDLSHTTGIVSMARSREYDSGGSQFFIMLNDAPSLDGDYAAFGKIIDGWDTIEMMKEEAVVEDEIMGTLVNNFTIEKTVIDLNAFTPGEVEKITE